MLSVLFIVLYFSVCQINCAVRKFSQIDFDQWIDEDNFLVVLFCNMDQDKNCLKEVEKLKQIADELVKHQDLVFGYISRESDTILFSRYNIVKTPFVKLFPYNEEIQNYPMNIRVPDLKEMILSTRTSILDKRIVPDKATTRRTKMFKIPDIDWIDMATTVKDPEKHAVLILYDDDCIEKCRILERVAKTFENEEQVSFYKMTYDQAGPLKSTMPFARNPSVFWYPKNDKEKGFIYAGEIRFEVLVEFINDRAGMSRDFTGQLKHDAGRIMEIDKIIKENIISILLKTNINYVIFLVEEQSKELPHAKKYIDYYIAVLKEIKKGSDPDQILHREQQYINDIIAKKTLKDSDKDEWKKFYNIVSAFIDFAATELHNDMKKRKIEMKEDVKMGTVRRSSHHDEL